ncbi:MAG: protein phosphatase 2C domain-containing protein [Deltaproteobacteria bacterium]|jgi:serine/threonine protein phosphatase PrpC|nr:protein phosphatase 2C domain-containing protein [Deltaproteobacteria bacterium]
MADDNDQTPQNVITEESKSAEIDSKAQVPPASEPTKVADDNAQTPQKGITEGSKSTEIDSKAQVLSTSEPTKMADDNAQTPQKGITEESKSAEIDSKAQVLSTSEPTKMADDNAQTPQNVITEESKSAEIDSKAQVLSTSEPTKVADDNASTKTTSDIGVQTLIHQKEPTIELTLKYNGIINNNSYHDTITDMENMIKDYPIIHSSYNSKISTKFFVYNDYSIIKCEGNDFLVNELGLKVEVKPNINIITLSETPKKGYDGKLYFNIAISNISNGGPRTFSKDIYIAPDPKSLWQDLPVDDFDGYETPNDTKEAIKIEAIDKIVIAASCRGRSHAHVGKPRDDSFAINIDKDSGWNIVAVADGAGSAKYSRKGSEIACQTVIKELMEILKSDEFNNYLVINNDIMINWRNIFNSDIYKNYKDIDNNYRNQTVFDKIFYKSVYTAYDNILNEAKTRGAKIRDYHTTLLFMAFKKFDFGYFYGSFWIGDGAMAIYNINADNKVLVLGAPDSGEFAGQTRFLTMSEEIKPEFIKKRTCFGFVDDFEAIILATDGITDPFFPSDACVASEEKWKEFWDKTLKLGDEENPGCPKVFDRQVSLEDKAQDLRNWLDFWSKGNHDDRTILIVK